MRGSRSCHPLENSPSRWMRPCGGMAVGLNSRSPIQANRRPRGGPIRPASRARAATGGIAPMTYSPAPGNIGSDERYRARRSSPSTLAPRQHRLRINTETQGRLLVHLRPRLLLGLLWGSRLWRLSTLRFAHWAVACRTHGTSGAVGTRPLGSTLTGTWVRVLAPTGSCGSASQIAPQTSRRERDR